MRPLNSSRTNPFSEATRNSGPTGDSVCRLNKVSITFWRIPRIGLCPAALSAALKANKKASRFHGRPSRGGLLLLLLLRLICCSRGCGRSQLLQVVLQEADFHATAVHALRLGLVVANCGWDRSVPHPDEVDAVNGNIVIQH